MEIFIFILFVVGTFIYAVAKSARKAAAILEGAKQDYTKTLAKLSEDPSNTRLKQECLAKGRVYANLTRSNKGVTVFDEVALSNDLSAACASASANPASIVQGKVQLASSTMPTGVNQAISLAERLSRLENLKKEGLISEVEYLTKREELLTEI